MSARSTARAEETKKDDAVGVLSRMRVLGEIRKTEEDALRDLAESVKKTDFQDLAKLSYYDLLNLFKEVVAAKDADALSRLIMVSEKPEAHFGHLEKELMQTVLAAYARVSFEAKDVVSPETDGKMTKLFRTLIEFVKAIPTGYGSTRILEAILAAKAPVDDIINTIIRSELPFMDKMRAVALCSDPNLHDDVFEKIQKSVISLFESGHVARDKEKQEAITVAVRLFDSDRGGNRLIALLVGHRDCEFATVLAEVVPSSFDVAMASVLTSGSPRAVAHFYRVHGKRCDKAAFHAKLTDAMRPNPEAMATAILEGHHGIGFGMHPMMVMEMMHGPGPFRRW